MASVSCKDVVPGLKMADYLQSFTIARTHQAFAEIVAGRVKGHCAKMTLMRSDLAFNNLCEYALLMRSNL